MFIDFKAIRQLLTDACDQYETTAPTVHAFCDDLYQRINGNPADVRLVELLTVFKLKEDEWEQPNYAANRIYHLQEQLGAATTGHAGF